ncbi:MAG: alpha-1,2-fucosyltransferase [Lachnospiraceae bacterium]|nr:alpha-1,2-fucosyltransferase [Lachnospiraceae bacterium]
MIVIHMIGGLGNQMYQYAMYLKLKSLGKKVCIDVTDYMPYAWEAEPRSLDILRFTDADFERCTRLQRFLVKHDDPSFAGKVWRKLFGRGKHIYEEHQDYDPAVFELEKGYLDGFWNCEKYFYDIIPLLQEKFTFPKTIDIITPFHVNRMHEYDSIGIHIRRTDYVDDEHRWRYGGICTDQYYWNAIQYAQKFVKNPIYYVFTDDLDYANSKISMVVRGMFPPPEVILCDWNEKGNSIYDMLMMSHCKVMICANSTFSMWGARLSKREDKVMIRPFRHDNVQDFSVEYMKDAWKDWVLIKEDGTIV